MAPVGERLFRTQVPSEFDSRHRLHAHVAQLAEASGREPDCWRFESSHVHQGGLTELDEGTGLLIRRRKPIVGSNPTALTYVLKSGCETMPALQDGQTSRPVLEGFKGEGWVAGLLQIMFRRTLPRDTGAPHRSREGKARNRVRRLPRSQVDHTREGVRLVQESPPDGAMSYM